MARTGTAYASESCDIIGTTNVSKTGTWKKTVTIKTGQLAPGSKTDATLGQCPQTSAQVHDGVQCIFAAANLSTDETAFSSVFFKVPKVTFTWVKDTKKKGFFNLTVENKGAYAPISKGSAVNNGGFEVIGTYTHGSTTTTSCQGTTASGVTWGVGLPACNGVMGEKIDVLFGTKLIGTASARTANTVAGEIDHTFKGVAGEAAHDHSQGFDQWSGVHRAHHHQVADPSVEHAARVRRAACSRLGAGASWWLPSPGDLGHQRTVRLGAPPGVARALDLDHARCRRAGGLRGDRREDRVRGPRPRSDRTLHSAWSPIHPASSTPPHPSRCSGWEAVPPSSWVGRPASLSWSTSSRRGAPPAKGARRGCERGAVWTCPIHRGRHGRRLPRPGAHLAASGRGHLLGRSGQRIARRGVRDGEFADDCVSRRSWPDRRAGARSPERENSSRDG